MKKQKSKTSIWMIVCLIVSVLLIIAIGLIIFLLNREPSYVGVYYNESWGEQFGYDYYSVSRQFPTKDYTKIEMANGSHIVLNKDGTCIFVSYLLFPKEAAPHDGRCFYEIEGDKITFNHWYTATLSDEGIRLDHNSAKYLFKKI